MKLLFLTFYFEPDLCAGSFRNTPLFKELLSQITDQDFIHVITSQPHRYSTYKAEGKKVETNARYRIDRINIPPHTSGLLGQIRSFYVFYYEALKLVKGEHYDLVYASSSRLFTAFLGKKIAVGKHTPLYLDIRDIFVDTMKDILKDVKYLQWPFERVFKQVEHYTFSKAEHINLVSEGFKGYFEQYHYPQYSYFTNGIDDLFLNVETGECLPVKNTREILYAGNIGKGQGLEKIIPQAALRLGKGYFFRIVGDGGTRQMLIDKLKELKVQNVELNDPVSRGQLMNYYRQADFLFLHLNDYDAFKKVLPSKLFEYAAFNKPIIAGVAGYAQRFIAENINHCILFHPTDVEDMVKQLLDYQICPVSRKGFVEKFARKNIMRDMAKDILQIVRN